MRYFLGVLVLALLAVVTLAGPACADRYSGSVTLGYTILDEEGNLGTNQPTFNVYEGFGLSLDNFRYNLGDGTRVYANLRNITLNNRNLDARVTKSGRFSLRLHTDQYRRTYDFAGSDFTRRHRTRGDLWIQPHRMVKLFGGYGLTGKKGAIPELFEPGDVIARNNVDYTHKHFNAGARVTHHRGSFSAEYRGSDFNDDLDATNARQSQRVRLAATSPLPRFRNVWLNAGFQHYEQRLTERHDTLSANTFWGGARVFTGPGFSGRYSFLFDRAQRTGDVVATDNIVQSFSLGKTWRGQGGVSVGYRHLITDDVFDELTRNGVYVSGWFVPLTDITLRADLGKAKTDEGGTTLTGDRDYTRLRGSVTYRHPYGKARIKAESRKHENDEIGSTIDFTRAGADLTLAAKRYGQFTGSYYYVEGEYAYTDGFFLFSDHVFSGEALAAPIFGAQVGVGGSYMRTRQGLDAERFSVSLIGIYKVQPRYSLKVVYTAHNYDDLLNAGQASLYSEYYTANIVEISLSTELGR